MIVLKNVRRTDSILKAFSKDNIRELQELAEQHLVEHLKEYFFQYGFDAIVEVKNDE